MPGGLVHHPRDRVPSPQAEGGRRDIDLASQVAQPWRRIKSRRPKKLYSAGGEGDIRRDGNLLQAAYLIGAWVAVQLGGARPPLHVLRDFGVGIQALP